MKLFRPLLLACLAFASISALWIVPSMAESQSPAVYTASTADDMLTAVVVAGVMRIAVLALALLAVTLLVIALVAAADRWWSHRRADRRLVFHDPWRLSEPYRRTPG
ncbi:MAG: hypothetical protein EOQ98_19450 [Mesorhizobium sp.]|uniref:hypothetical protein n=1 Tax=Mesorhizobium sp. TaxID=1871066 RepID=UPI000FE9AEB0|nr:hypothetical protein [Mesorhizobium sp.]RWO97209.1 MAG: hypothetical protein EOQ98_19450 [Mesorhizobium sp.]TIM52574.1 MAG: hypothetical protein E5Y69_00700 [Mesorhizobium sp.]